MTVRAVLFDLDGTLADTAPDLAGALNELLAERGRPAVPVSRARPLTASGARGMLRVGFGIDPQHEEYEVLKTRFLELYESRLCVDTSLFAGIAELLDALEARAIPWGIVTNKAERYTFPLLKALRLSERAACIVGGDTVQRAKPHPDPLLHAARAMTLDPGSCLYVGDDRRDIDAARAAAMPVIAAAYGYLGESADPHEWGADAVIDHPLEVLNHLRSPPFMR